LRQYRRTSSYRREFQATSGFGVWNNKAESGANSVDCLQITGYSGNPYTGILSIFSTQIKNNNEINIFEDGKESRDFVYIYDAVDATILGIENNNITSDIFNVGAATPIDVLTVAQTLLREYDSTVACAITGNFRLGDIRHNYADLTKTRALLGYEPKYHFEEGISRFAEWVNEQEIKEDNFNKSILEMKEKGLFK